jgi:hypothetical protein
MNFIKPSEALQDTQLIFSTKRLIPMADALEANVNKRAAVYESSTNQFSFLTDLNISKERLCRDANLLKKDCAQTLAITLVENYISFRLREGKVIQTQNVTVIGQGKNHLVFPNTKAIRQVS